MKTPHIDSIGARNLVARPVPNAGRGKSDVGFRAVLTEQLLQMNEQQLQADSAVAALATGETEDINSVVMQMAEADLSFRLAIEIRNRLLESYQEIMRLQV